jgi:Ala-tRNA(Pro) deacylase
VSAVLDAIRRLLDDHGIPYREVHHPPTRTSRESAEARGESMDIGGKAIVFKVDDAFHLFVLSASLQIRSRAIRKHLGARRTRFANEEELLEMTGLVPGCVPPFGPPILPFDVYVDPSVLANDRIAFNAGSLTDSIVMDRGDWERLVRPAGVFPFAGPPEGGRTP